MTSLSASLYGADEQCKILMGKDAKYCRVITYNLKTKRKLFNLMIKYFIFDFSAIWKSYVQIAVLQTQFKQQL
jgi:hypothetical protein